MKTKNITAPDLKMLEARKFLLTLAQKRHGLIVPCGNWNNSFTLEGNKLFFWYISSKDNSTHLVSQVIDNF